MQAEPAASWRWMHFPVMGTLGQSLSALQGSPLEEQFPSGAEPPAPALPAEPPLPATPVPASVPEVPPLDGEPPLDVEVEVPAEPPLDVAPPPVGEPPLPVLVEPPLAVAPSPEVTRPPHAGTSTMNKPTRVAPETDEPRRRGRRHSMRTV